MFKIPSYDELEKKEKEQDEANKNYKGNLFQKRKLDASNENESEPTAKKQDKIEQISARAQTPADDDDDDDLLNAFLTENKEIIEKPVQKPVENTETVFKKPTLPAPAAPKTIANSTVQTSSSNQSSFGGGSLLVNSKQRGNPILKHVRNVQWGFSDTLVPDYCMSRSSCAFYLSMKYHLLNPTYIDQRIRELGRAYDLRVLLVYVDVKEPRHCIKELEKICIYSNLTLMLCWSSEECGRYLETYKAYEFKGADLIMEKSNSFTNQTSSHSSGSGSLNQTDSNFITNYTEFLCAIKSINKTDASTLRQTFGSIKELSKASKEELNLCPGLGPLKVNRLYEIFRTPFVLTKK